MVMVLSSREELAIKAPKNARRIPEKVRLGYTPTIMKANPTSMAITEVAMAAV
jgi:hypothetical protein